MLVQQAVRGENISSLSPLVYIRPSLRPRPRPLPLSPSLAEKGLSEWSNLSNSQIKGTPLPYFFVMMIRGATVSMWPLKLLYPRDCGHSSLFLKNCSCLRALNILNMDLNREVIFNDKESFTPP